MNILVKTLIFLLLFSHSYAEIKFAVQEDEFTDERVEYAADMTGISAKIEKSLETVDDQWVYFAYDGKSCYLSLNAYYEDWNELGNEQAYVILDGEKWNKHDFIPDTEVVDGGDVRESYGFMYRKEFCEKLMNSKNFRAKVGNLVFSIDLTKFPMSKFTLF